MGSETRQENHGNRKDRKNRKKQNEKNGQGRNHGLSLSAIIICLVVGIVAGALILAMTIFLSIYTGSVDQIAVTNSVQAVAQVSNTVENYREDMQEIMKSIEYSYRFDQERRSAAMDSLVGMRSDVVAVFCYDQQGRMKETWCGERSMKETVFRNLSYVEPELCKDKQAYISKPHVESLLTDYYPWVVSIAQEMESPEGGRSLVVMDIRFSKIANYVDNVGIGQHGYCFIMNSQGDIIYHPQQQLIYSGLKHEETKELALREDGAFHDGNVIYAIQSLPDKDWRVVGVSYLDEVVTDRLNTMKHILLVLVAAVVLAVLVSSIVLSHMVSGPIRGLVKAMQEFEKEAAAFSYHPVRGSREIMELSRSFEHMVGQIQELMTRVRNEEITLRKTELKALQAQINPHFLYNTLDAIGWMCEEERSREAVEMVNALAKLFRISISKGHELISIEKELEHARSYLMIQKFRYKNQFLYEFEVEEACLPYMCNKITLQPIIENAIYHGIDRMVDQGLITIRIFKDGEDIVFQVEDNGIGMTQEQCRRILAAEPGDHKGPGGIGIKNVNDRIRIYFGDQYGITIESELDEGTCVTIRMPAVEEGSYEVK